MDRAELEKSWATTGRHLLAARDNLPQEPALGVEGATVADFLECMDHNEQELALYELEDMGLTNAPPAVFWQQLMYAAENMKLFDRAAEFKQRMEGA